MKTLIRGGTVIPVTGASGALEHCDVYVEDKRVVGVGQAPPAFSTPEADKVIEAQGCLIMPGFVNAHGHISLGLSRGLCEFVPGATWQSSQTRAGSFGSRLTEEDIYDGALLCMAEMIRSGTTTFTDIHQEGFGAPPVTDLIAYAAEASGMRASLSLAVGGYIASTTFPRIRFSYRQQETDRTLTNSLSVASRWHGQAGGRVTTMLGIACPPVPPLALLEQVARAAAETGQPISMHIAEIAHEMVEWKDRFQALPAEVLLQAGVLGVHVLGGNCVFLTVEDAQVLKDYNFHATTCPQNCCKLSLGMLDVPMLLEHGVNVALGTNEASNNNNLDMIEEMRLAALYHKLATGDRGCLGGELPLEMITANGGRALDLEVGTIERGQLADLVIMDVSGPHMHPRHDVVANLIYSSAAADVQTVLIDGQVVMEDRQILTFDADDVADRVEARMSELRQDLPSIELGPDPVPSAIEWAVD